MYKTLIAISILTLALAGCQASDTNANGSRCVDAQMRVVDQSFCAQQESSNLMYNLWLYYWYFGGMGWRTGDQATGGYISNARKPTYSNSAAPSTSTPGRSFSNSSSSRTFTAPSTTAPSTASPSRSYGSNSSSSRSYSTPSSSGSSRNFGSSSSGSSRSYGSSGSSSSSRSFGSSKR